MSEKSVVFPAPFIPRSATNAPAAIVRLTSSSARTDPKLWLTPLICSAGTSA